MSTMSAISVCDAARSLPQQRTAADASEHLRILLQPSSRNHLRLD